MCRGLGLIATNIEGWILGNPLLDGGGGLEGRAFASAGLSRDFQTPLKSPLVQGGTNHFASSGSSTN